MEVNYFENPAQWINDHCMIGHPIRGSIPFELHKYQKDIINAWHNNRFVVSVHARQVGVSTLIAAYALWMAIHRIDSSILITDVKNIHAMGLMDKIRYMYDNLDYGELKSKALYKNKTYFELDNGSRIIAATTNGCTGRGFRLDMVMSSTFDYVRPELQEEFFKAIIPAIAYDGGKMIVSSTPSHEENTLFKRIANGDVGYFVRTTTKYHQHPGWDEAFKNANVDRMGIDRWNLEYECKM